MIGDRMSLRLTVSHGTGKLFSEVDNNSPQRRLNEFHAPDLSEDYRWFGRRV